VFRITSMYDMPLYGHIRDWDNPVEVVRTSTAFSLAKHKIACTLVQDFIVPQYNKFLCYSMVILVVLYNYFLLLMPRILTTLYRILLILRTEGGHTAKVLDPIRFCYNHTRNISRPTHTPVWFYSLLFSSYMQQFWG
jgi:hypothetical protein